MCSKNNILCVNSPSLNVAFSENYPIWKLSTLVILPLLFCIDSSMILRLPFLNSCFLRAITFFVSPWMISNKRIWSFPYFVRLNSQSGLSQTFVWRRWRISHILHNDKTVMRYPSYIFLQHENIQIFQGIKLHKKFYNLLIMFFYKSKFLRKRNFQDLINSKYCRYKKKSDLAGNMLIREFSIKID